MTPHQLISATDLEQETGLSTALLRTWRSRYGFPTLVRREDGSQGYPREQIQQLRLIKRLQQAGIRPGQIVGKPLAELDQLVNTVTLAHVHPVWNPSVGEAIDLLKQHDLEGLEALLLKQRTRYTSRTDFIEQTVAPLVTEVGEAWAQGDINVYEEHLCTVLLMRLLFAEIASTQPKAGYPRILFATPPGEAHVLGLMMAQVVLGECGALGISVGPQIAPEELSMAARAYRADIVALSISAAYPTKYLQPMIAQLRDLVPAAMTLWIGGAGTSKIKRAPNGVRLFPDLALAATALADYVKKTHH